MQDRLVTGAFIACVVLACESGGPGQGQSLAQFDAVAGEAGPPDGDASNGPGPDEPAGAGESSVGDCAPGQTSCSGSLLAGISDQSQCVDLSSSGLHCGRCGNACPISQVCNAGTCAAACDSGLMQCGSSCVSDADPRNCGGCGQVCGLGQACVAGACSCPSGLSACGASCVDTTADANHCGACGVQCGGGECVDGACPPGKLCASSVRLQSPTLADFESYDPATAPDAFGFAFNGAPGTPQAVYSGTYHYDDGTGAQTLEMVAGNGSEYAVAVENSGASDWGGALGLWMGCIDASGFDGITFAVRGSVPGGLATLATPTEGTSPPDEADAAAGGTCLAGCAAPSAEFPVFAEWSRVLLPWSAFSPGSADGASLPMDGTGLTGMTFGVALEWAEVPGAPGTYGPNASPYELAVDDVGFFRTAEVCGQGEVVCDSRCVDLSSDQAHCGACGQACTGGSLCDAQRGCTCPDGLTFCAGSCVDLSSDGSHCGSCGNFCAISAQCSGGTCQGGNAPTSNRCGQTTTLLGNPLGCEFAWGANVESGIPGYLDFATKWVGYEPNLDTRCDGCGWLAGFDAPGVPTYIAYFAAYRANIEAGLGDCNLDFDGNNLCTGGAQWIRDNRGRLVDMYASYAARSYAVAPNRPVIWILEPDYSQYAEPSQSNPLSMNELGGVMADIICAIKGNMPNAVIALNHSTWLQGGTLSGFWNAMPLDLIDMIHVTSRADVPGGYFNASDANNRQDGTFGFLSQLTGKPLLADTSFGVTTMQDSWSTANAQTLNARIDDGVVGVLIFPTPGPYQQRIQSLAPSLASTCQ